MLFKKFIILVLFFSISVNNERPKIALVLSGGGAKGVSHIATMQIIDSLNIPIDLVVGTSIGAITGAMYSMGYSPEEIKQNAFNTNWDLIFSNKTNRRKLYYFQKNDYDEYQFNFTLKGIRPQVPMAITNGHYSYFNLLTKTQNYDYINDFNNLVIPFRCNAVDLLTGREIIFSNGSLSKALRASSSIPSIFSPMEYNNYFLIDGGVVNNFPTDIAKNLDADFIIGVNLSPISKNKEDINNIFDVLEQSIIINGFNKRNQAYKNANIIIEPDVLEYSSLDFNPSTLEKLYFSGQKAAYSQIDKFLQLKKQIVSYENDKTNFSSIKENIFKINKLIINSKDDINNRTFNQKYNLVGTTSKNIFLNTIQNIRNSNQFSHINYKFLEEDNGFILFLNLNKIPSILINEIIINGNKELKSSFIKEILSIKKGDVYDANKIKKNIDYAYNLDLFESIQYELVETNKGYNIIFNIQESSYHKMKISGSWHSYHKILANINFVLFNEPFKKVRFTNKYRLGNSIRENEISMFYIGNYNYKRIVTPTLRTKTIQNEVGYYYDNILDDYRIKSKTYSMIALLSLKNYGFIEIGNNTQKTKYSLSSNKENIKYNHIKLEIDQIDDIYYPTNGYRYYFYSEKGYGNYNYKLNKLTFDYYIKLSKNYIMKIFSDIFSSNLAYFDTNTLIIKNINYIPVDRGLTNSQYKLFANKFSLIGYEFNYLYKNSTTFRIIFSNINNITLKHSDKQFSNLSSYGFGIRVKSIFGPLNFIWTKSKNSLIESKKENNFFFNIGFEL